MFLKGLEGRQITIAILVKTDIIIGHMTYNILLYMNDMSDIRVEYIYG